MNVLPIAMTEVSSAYCVAVARISQMLIMKATNAHVAKPPHTLSIDRTNRSDVTGALAGAMCATVAPWVLAKIQKPTLLTAAKMPAIHKQRVKLQRAIMSPPTIVPAMLRPDPKLWRTHPIVSVE